MKVSIAIPITLAGVLAAGTANASWVANYTAFGGPTVSPMDGYGIGTGDVLLKKSSGAGTPASPQVNDIYNGIFQTYISNNLYQGSPITSQGNLNDFSGSTGGTPYELTLAGNFTEKVTGTSSTGVNFDLTGGTASIYASSNVNYSFQTDTGFTDGTSILQGNIVSGTGSFGSFGFGVTSLTLKVTNYDSGVYNPAVGGANAVITLQGKGAPGAGYTGFLDNVTSVGGALYEPGNGDVLLSSAGNMALTPVPLPAAIWLFGSGLVGLVGISRRRRR